MATSSIYTFRLKDNSGNVIANLVNATNRRFTLGLNVAGSASFDLDLSDPNVNLIGVGGSTLEVLRGSTVLFAGQVSIMSRYLGEIDRKVKVSAIGWFDLLGTRFTGLTTPREFTTPTDAGEIAETLINETQALTNGNFGFTIGTIQTSVDRTITYSRSSIKQAITDLANALNGFDFEITPDKVFNVYYPFKGSIKADLEMKFPGNIREIEEMQDSTTIANFVLGLGAGFGLAELNTTKSDTDSQTVYKRREKVASFKDIDDQSILEDLTENEVNQFRTPQLVYRLSVHGEQDPQIGSYVVGDFITISVDDTYWDLRQQFRIFQIDTSIDEEDKEDVTLTVGLI